MNAFAPLFIFALLIEALVERLSLAPRQKPWAAIVVGVLVCALYRVDLLLALGYPCPVPYIGPYVGSVATGILMSRGANIFADLIKLLRSLPFVTLLSASKQPIEADKQEPKP